MRILYSHRVQSRDGQSVHIEELVAAFRKEGHEVLVAGPGFYNRAAFGGESGLVPLIRGALPNWSTEVAEILYNVIAYRRLRRAYRRFAPDVIYERYNLYHLAGALLRRRYPTKLLLEVNSPLAEERARFGGLAFHRLARKLERYIWQSADRVFVVSNVLKQDVIAAGVSAEKITVVPNGVDLDTFPGRALSRRTEMPLTVGFIGFLRDWHGLGAIIAGLSEEPFKDAIRLMIVGDGPARVSLEDQVNRLAVSNQVKFFGLQHRHNIAEMIYSFDIAVQPRSVTYASPLKLFEYMACARAIVAPDQPNIREILDHNETALLFDPLKPDALWEAIRQLAIQPDLRKRLGCSARRTLKERNYTWQGNVLRITAAAALVTVGVAEKNEIAHDLLLPSE